MAKENVSKLHALYSGLTSINTTFWFLTNFKLLCNTNRAKPHSTMCFQSHIAQKHGNIIRLDFWNSKNHRIYNFSLRPKSGNLVLLISLKKYKGLFFNFLRLNHYQTLFKFKRTTPSGKPIRNSFSPPWNPLSCRKCFDLSRYLFCQSAIRMKTWIKLLSAQPSNYEVATQSLCKIYTHSSDRHTVVRQKWFLWNQLWTGLVYA